MASKKSFSANMPAEMFVSEETKEASRSKSTQPPAGYKPDYGVIETKSRRVQLLMQPSLHTKLKAEAERQGVSFNDYVHKVLEKAVEG